MLRDKLGAELVESVDPMYADDPTVPNMKYTFQDAFAEILPHNVPEYFWQKTPIGRARVRRAWLGRDDGRLRGRAGAAARRRCRRSSNLRRISKQPRQPAQPVRRATSICASAATRASRTGRAGWRTRSSTSDEQRAGAENALRRCRTRASNPTRISYLKMQSALRLIVLKVMHENGIDAFVNPENRRCRRTSSAGRRADGRTTATTISCCQRVHRADGRPGDGRAGRLHAASSTNRSTC